MRADLHINSESVTTHETVLQSKDDLATVSIPSGIVAKDATGMPLTTVSITPISESAVPADTSGGTFAFTGIAYDLGPDGATFNPPATLSFTVPGDQWNRDTTYFIRSYSAQTGSWKDIPTSVDPGSRVVTGQISHLCLFGLFAAPAAPATPATTLRAPVATLQVQPESISQTPMGIFTGLMGWVYATAVAHIQVSATILLAALVGVYTSTRKAWLSRNRTWITLYLISLTGLLWAAFLFEGGAPFWEPSWILITVTGLNLIVHIFRFDRIDISARARPRYKKFGYS
jgi:hypothetical protein